MLQFDGRGSTGSQGLRLSRNARRRAVVATFSTVDTSTTWRAWSPETPTTRNVVLLGQACWVVTGVTACRALEQHVDIVVRRRLRACPPCAAPGSVPSSMERPAVSSRRGGLRRAGSRDALGVATANIVEVLLDRRQGGLERLHRGTRQRWSGSWQRRRGSGPPRERVRDRSTTNRPRSSKGKSYQRWGSRGRCRWCGTRATFTMRGLAAVGVQVSSGPVLCDDLGFGRRGCGTSPSRYSRPSGWRCGR